MSFAKPTQNYWDDKFIAYLHDPFDKVFRIQEHEKRAAEILEIFGLQWPNEKELLLQQADGIASGFERGQVPSYSENVNKNGAIDFLENPVLTHPLGKDALLKIDLPTSTTAVSVFNAFKEFLKIEIGINAGKGGYSDLFKGNTEAFARARFFYTHLALRFLLAEKNVAGLGGLWHRIPADSRFPDHSIWQHNQLTSALFSCMKLGENADDLGLMAFSITPVQGFIASARKLRDFWSGSFILSWLAFEGNRWVMENLGPDHVIYPSLIDQPLVAEYLKRNFQIDQAFRPKLWDSHDPGVASFPNKFLLMIPFSKAQEIGKEIQAHIAAEWGKYYRQCGEFLLEKVNTLAQDEKEIIREMFKRQCGTFWEMHWASAKLIGENDKIEVEKLLAKDVWEESFAVLEIFNRIIKDTNYNKSGKGVLYTVSHSLGQAGLSVQKSRRTIQRQAEPAIKCHQCGELEVLSGRRHQKESAAQWTNILKKFWKQIADSWTSDVDFKEYEMLCSLCLTKRISQKAFAATDHILSTGFKGNDSYPSTTELSLYDYFHRNNIDVNNEKKRIADRFHSKPDHGDSGNTDNYFAILLLDGDFIGKLVNGETVASTWQSVIHPVLKERFVNPLFDKKYREPWSDLFNNHPKRLVTPALHAAISESLGDFALYGAAPLIKKAGGRLIYAGGDDICAVMPMNTVVETAQKIRAFYHAYYRLIDQDAQSNINFNKNWLPKAGKLSIGLGENCPTVKISISAAILIAHHKEPLSQLIVDAQKLLKNKAKGETGRDALAVELRKRSGGSRFFARKWDDPAWQAFADAGKAMKGSSERISTSLAYRLNEFKDGIDAILASNNWEINLQKFVFKQLERSMVAGDEDDMKKFSHDIGALIINKNKAGTTVFEPDGLIMAGFMVGGEKSNELV